MREILFRGKRIDNNLWAYGYAVKYEKCLWIYTGKIHTIEGHVNEYGLPFTREERYEVDSETICQYTGLNDKNGKKIFEGDIVQEQDDKCVGIVRYGVYDSSFNSDGLGGHMGFYIEWKEGRIKLRRIDIVFWSDVIEVIGNIFDNPELMETDYE